MQPVGNDDRANGEASSTLKKGRCKQATRAVGATGGDDGNERTFSGDGSTTPERNRSKVYYKTLKV